MSAQKKQAKKKFNYPKEDRITEENSSREKKKEKKRKTKKNGINTSKKIISFIKKKRI